MIYVTGAGLVGGLLLELEPELPGGLLLELELSFFFVKSTQKLMVRFL